MKASWQLTHHCHYERQDRLSDIHCLVTVVTRHQSQYTGSKDSPPCLCHPKAPVERFFVLHVGKRPEYNYHLLLLFMKIVTNMSNMEDTTSEVTAQALYTEGQVLELRLPDSKTFKVVIKHFYEPFSMSIVARVSLASEKPAPLGLLDDPEFILKIYDRRAASSMREWHRATEPYDSSEAAALFEHLLKDPPTAEELEEDYDDLDDKLREAAEVALGLSSDSELPVPLLSQPAISRVMQNRGLQMACTEEKTYEHLKAMQESGQIPTYFGRAELVTGQGFQLPSHLGDTQAAIIKQYLSIPAALISYVPGTPLERIQEIVPKEDWKKVVNLAMDVVNEFGDHDALNTDVATRDIIIQMGETDEGNEYKAVAIDLAQCRMRRADEDDES